MPARDTRQLVVGRGVVVAVLVEGVREPLGVERRGRGRNRPILVRRRPIVVVIPEELPGPHHGAALVVHVDLGGLVERVDGGLEAVEAAGDDLDERGEARSREVGEKAGAIRAGVVGHGPRRERRAAPAGLAEREER